LSGKSELREKLAELDRQIEEMKVAGNRAGQAVAHTQKTLLYTLSMDLQAAAQEIAKAGALAEQDGRFEELALAHYGQGKALLNQPGRHKAARDHLDKAAALLHILEDPVREAQALKELAALDAAGGDWPRAVERLTQALALLEDESDSALTIELHRLRARCHLFQRDPDAALIDLDAALDLAQQSENTALALEIRAEQVTIRGLAFENVMPDVLAALLREAQQGGKFQVIADIQLQGAARSLQAGEYRQALEQAQAARQAARDADDIARPLRYLMASLLMADAQEKLGDRAEALAALLTCKVYLETHLGPQAGAQMNALLDTLEQRWGRDGLAKAIRLYKQRVQERGPYQV
jgi:hypothetical protein